MLLLIWGWPPVDNVATLISKDNLVVERSVRQQFRPSMIKASLGWRVNWRYFSAIEVTEYA